MRTFWLSIIVGIFCLTSTHAKDVQAPVELSQSERLMQVYETWWHAINGDKARCIEFLQKLTTGRYILPGSPAGSKMDARLRAVGCLDEYSYLYTFGVVDRQPEQKRLDEPSVEKIGSYLFVFISFFHHVDTKIIEMVQKHLAKSQDAIDTVVIDVRGNEGGSIGELHEILNKLFSPQAGIRHLEPSGRMTFKENPNYFTTNQRGILSGRKIRILTDAITASASEWMIETLCNEWYPDSCMSLGTTTFGKAVLQCGVHDKEFIVQLTCAEWFLKGKTLKDQAQLPQKVQGVGITPDKSMTFDCDRFAYSCIAQRLADAGL